MVKYDVMALLSAKGIGVQTLHKLLEYYGDVEVLLDHAKQNCIYRDTGIKATQDIHLSFGAFDKMKYMTVLKREGVELVGMYEGDYPQILKSVDHYPFVLHYKGHMAWLNQLPPAIAVVGSRKASAYGKRVAYDLGKFLARYGIPVVSGLAYGVDYEVHSGVVDGGGIPIAVLANGLESVYPRDHTALAKKIEASGALITEEFLYSELKQYKFPIRNRLISGLSKIIVVVEAEEKSGSLITARHGLEQGKSIFAVPGSIYSSNSRGTHRLLSEGAMPLFDFNQLLEDYCLDKKTFDEKNVIGDNDTLVTSIIRSLKAKGALSVEAVSDGIGEDIVIVTTALMKMELSGRVRCIGGNKYVLI
ncbi:MAG: DNA-processing protein DprA [Clostridia bacterium]|nr:DNA-processing protein DprA [Clostridia bacterium]